MVATGATEVEYIDQSTLSAGTAASIDSDTDSTKELSISGTNLRLDPDDDGTNEVTFCVTSGVLTIMYEDTDTADGSSWTECGFDDGVMTCGSDADGVCDGTI